MIDFHYTFGLDGTRREELVTVDEDGDTHTAGMDAVLRTGDYSELPSGGAYHFDLDDAARAVSLDMWVADALPDLPFDGWKKDEGEGGFLLNTLASEAVHTSLRPLRARLRASLVASIEAGRLDAIVLQRDLVDGLPDPLRTYVSLEDLETWVKHHGHRPSHVFADLSLEAMQRADDFAGAVARDRLLFRIGQAPDDADSPAEDEESAIDGDHLLAENALLRAKIQELKARQRRTEEGPEISVKKENLAKMIAALLALLEGLHPDWVPVPRITESAKKLGLGLDEKTIRTALKQIPLGK
jgi:hypothetical protein